MPAARRITLALDVALQPAGAADLTVAVAGADTPQGTLYIGVYAAPA
jgi:uncharacterized protein (DUF2141 family)